MLDNTETVAVSGESEGSGIDIFYLLDNKNYVVLQGVTYCASFVTETYEPSEEYPGKYDPVYKHIETVITYTDLESVYEPNALGGVGGHCFPFFMQDNDLPNQQFVQIMDKVKE